MMSEKYTVARLTRGSERFEILVHPQGALEFRQGKEVELSRVLFTDTIFVDASKGMRASEDKLKEAFKTVDPLEIASTILRKGELQFTTEQRQKMAEEKRRQIVSFISRHCVDPRSSLPHPPLRIEQAMAQARCPIDPFRAAEEQAREVIDKLRPILPLRMEQIQLAVKIPPEYAAQAMGAVKSLSEIKRGEWQSDGSWIAVVEIPAGMHGAFLDKIQQVCRGSAQTKILK